MTYVPVAKKRAVSKAIPGPRPSPPPAPPRIKTREELANDKLRFEEEIRRKLTKDKERLDNKDYGQW